MTKKNYHVVPSDGNWKVKGAGSRRADSIHPTQKSAIDRARDLAQKSHSEVVIHGRDGKIRYKDSYGNDPHPPIDKKY